MEIPIHLNGPVAERLVREVATDTARVFLTAHAKQRMKERKIDRAQVFEVLRRGRVIEAPSRQPGGEWKFTMQRMAMGDDVTVAVVLDRDERGNLVAVLTVY